jgi:uncharacterized protein (TIGR02266 family)
MAAASPMVVKTVLVADDTEFVRERFRAAIEAAGHRALVARTRTEVLALIGRDAPRVDLVLLDLRLADGRGVDMLRAVRQHGDHPVIIFSGTIASTGEVRQLTDLGISGYINEYTGAQHIVPALAPHLFPDEHNRRSSPRVALGVSVSYRMRNSIASGLSLNISTGGLAVRSTNPHPVDAVVKVRFRLPKGTHDIEADARVAWADTRLGMGLQFTRIAPSDQALVDAFVTSHFFSNRKA